MAMDRIDIETLAAQLTERYHSALKEFEAQLDEQYKKDCEQYKQQRKELPAMLTRQQKNSLLGMSGATEGFMRDVLGSYLDIVLDYRLTKESEYSNQKEIKAAKKKMDLERSIVVPNLVAGYLRTHHEEWYHPQIEPQ